MPWLSVQTHRGNKSTEASFFTFLCASSLNKIVSINIGSNVRNWEESRHSDSCESAEDDYEDFLQSQLLRFAS